MSDLLIQRLRRRILREAKHVAAAEAGQASRPGNEEEPERAHAAEEVTVGALPGPRLGLGEGLQLEAADQVMGPRARPRLAARHGPAYHRRSMGGRLKGRTVLITGAAGGIGAACARGMAAEGARLVLADLDAAAVERLAHELSGVAVAADVRRRADVERMLDAAHQHGGRLDVLFNNVGIVQVTPLLDLTEDDWDRVMEVNLKGAFFVMQAAVRRMVGQDLIPGSELRGKLIQTASIASYRGGNHLMTHYSASKAGVVSFTRSAALALAPRPPGLRRLQRRAGAGRRPPAKGGCPGARPQPLVRPRGAGGRSGDRARDPSTSTTWPTGWCSSAPR